MKKVLSMLKDTFEEKLQAKNSWGKNEVQVLFRECLTEVLLEACMDAASPMERFGL